MEIGIELSGSEREDEVNMEERSENKVKDGQTSGNEDRK